MFLNKLRIEDLFDFEFGLVRDDDWGRRWLHMAGDIGFDITFEEGNMQDRCGEVTGLLINFRSYLALV